MSSSQPSFLDVTGAELELLAEDRAVILFRKLQFAESQELGLPIPKINTSERTKVPDGGLDSSIDNDTGIRGNLIDLGFNGYQIKTGKSFNPTNESDLKKELFGTLAKRNSIPSKDNLGQSVRGCMDRNGKFILVCFGKDLVDPQRQKAIVKLEQLFISCGYLTPRVDVWSQSQLILFLDKYPTIRAVVKGFGFIDFQLHESWSGDVEMARAFSPGSEQQQVIDNLKDELLKNKEGSEAFHVRVLGEPGIGKTRLVLEATRHEQLSPLIAYYSNSETFLNSTLYYKLLQNDNNSRVILVIDECDYSDTSNILNKLKYRGSKIKIVTIYNEYDNSSTYQIDAPALEPEQIKQIILSYKVGQSEIDYRFIDFCSGSPRVAHVIGWNLENYPEDIFKSPDTVPIWERYIAGKERPGSLKARQNEKVLKYLSLFKKFGFEAPLYVEAEAINHLINDPNIDSIFDDIIREFRNRKILQGKVTLYITPKALQIKLWRDRWNDNGHKFNFENFSFAIPPQLLGWFFDMFKYGAESKAATEIIK